MLTILGQNLGQILPGFNPRRGISLTHAHTKNEGPRSNIEVVRVFTGQTDTQTDTTETITLPSPRAVTTIIRI